MVKLIYNATIDNCGHCDFRKLRHNRKIFCRLGQYWMQAAIKLKNIALKKRFRSLDRTHSECGSNLMKILPQIQMKTKKKSLPQFDGIFGPKLTFYQRIFCLNGQDAFF